ASMVVDEQLAASDGGHGNGLQADVVLAMIDISLHGRRYLTQDRGAGLNCSRHNYGLIDPISDFIAFAGKSWFSIRCCRSFARASAAALLLSASRSTVEHIPGRMAAWSTNVAVEKSP